MLIKTFIKIINSFLWLVNKKWAFLVAQLLKDPTAMWETWIRPSVGKILWRRERLPTPASWPGEVHGLYSP